MNQLALRLKEEVLALLPAGFLVAAASTDVSLPRNAFLHWTCFRWKYTFIRIVTMPLQRADASSAVYWEGTGIDDEDLLDDSSLLDTASNENSIENTEEAGGTTSILAHHNASTKQAPADVLSGGQPSITRAVNKQEPTTTDTDDKGDEPLDMNASSANDFAKDLRTDVEVAEGDDDDNEEFTFNPDAELQDAQAAYHDYESAQFYEKVNFGEFGKYMRNKRRKLDVQQGAFKLNAKDGETSNVLAGLRIHVSVSGDTLLGISC